jgi:hippurate hydrolase
MAAQKTLKNASAILANLSKLLPDLEASYKDIHAHPELSIREKRPRKVRRR